jgi:hypothetical protein
MDAVNVPNVGDAPQASVLAHGMRPKWANGSIPLGYTCHFDSELPSVTWKSDDYRVSGEVVIKRDVPVFPVCQAGINRSQIIYRLVEELGCEAFRPHGVLHGPRARFALTICKFERLPRRDEFEQILGERPIWRVGEGAYDIHSWQFAAKELWFDPLIDNGGQVIISHDALTPFLGQLIDFSEGRSLEKVRISTIRAENPSGLSDPYACDKFVEAMRGLLRVA